MSRPVTAILTGPTATGKTTLALELAERSTTPLELINADSLLMYRHLDIGTAKPTAEEQAKVPHHLIDVRDPGEHFTAADFVNGAREAIARIHARGRRALIVGGSGFYLKALLHGLWDVPRADPALRKRLEGEESGELYARLRTRDPKAARRIGTNDRYRLIRALEMIEQSGKTPTQLHDERPTGTDPAYELWVIDRDREELQGRIARRTKDMIRAGLVDEARTLRGRYPGARQLSAVGYAQALAHLDGVVPAGRQPVAGVDGLASEIELATRQLVKAQRTWFRAQAGAKFFTLDAQYADVIAAFGRVYDARAERAGSA